MMHTNYLLKKINVTRRIDAAFNRKQIPAWRDDDITAQSEKHY